MRRWPDLCVTFGSFPPFPARRADGVAGPACHGPGAQLSLAAPAPGPGPAVAATLGPVFQSRSVPPSLFLARVRSVAGRRPLGLGLAMAIEALLVLLVLTLAPAVQPEVEKQRPTVVTFIAPEASEDSPEPPRPDSAQRSETHPEPRQPQSDQPQPPQPVQPPAETIAPPAPAIVPMRWSLTQSAPRAAAPAAIGPPDNRSVMFRDTERVGTAPNGQPLYAAEWYREPDRAMMRAYLSSAHGPGWGLIACRTAPEFRVEDCVALDEFPQGSQIARSALAAAWEFRVRPPRRGGQVLVGSWVRIRISYN